MCHILPILFIGENSQQKKKKLQSNHQSRTFYKNVNKKTAMPGAVIHKY